MTTLSERQQTAQTLARSIGAMEGAWVVSPLPLDASKRLRFQVLDGDKNRVLQQLHDWNWEPKFVSILPRVTFAGMAAGSVYEIDIPQPRQDIVDGRTIPKDEIVSRKPPSAEVEGMKKYLGLK